MSKKTDRIHFEILMNLLRQQFMSREAVKWDNNGIYKMEAAVHDILKGKASPGLSTYKKWVGMDKNYLGVPTVGNRDLLARVAGFDDWAHFVRSQKNPMAGDSVSRIPETRMAILNGSLILGLPGILACLGLLRHPGLRPGLPFAWTWVTGLLCLFLLTWVTGQRRFREKASWIRWQRKFLPWGNPHIPALLLGLSALFLIFQLLAFRPVEFFIGDQMKNSAIESIEVQIDRGEGLRTLAVVRRGESEVVWLPLGKHGLVYSQPDHDYPVGDRLHLKMGLSLHTCPIEF